MTEDYKSNLLKYLTGNLDAESGTDTITFEAGATNYNYLRDYLETNFNQYFIVDLLQSVTNDMYVLVAGYWETGPEVRGIIILLDKDFNRIKTFTQYDSGVNIGRIYSMNVREDGKFYMIENRLSDNTDRFILLNNFTIEQANNDYSLDIKDAYSIPNINYFVVNYNKILKSPGEAKYLIVMTIIDYDVYVPFAFELVVNVGSANEWNQYLYDGSVIGDGMEITDAWASWSESSLTFKIVGLLNDKYAEVYNNSTSTMTYRTLGLPVPIDDFIDQRRTGIVINENTAYYAMWGYSDSDTSQCFIYLYKVNYSINALELIASIPSEIPGTMGLVGDLSMNFYKWQDNCYFLVTTDINTANSTEDVTLMRLVGNKIYSNLVLQHVYINNLHLVAINNKYNLFNIIVQDGDRAFSFKEVYNPNNYNGLPYEAPNCLVPNSAILYDDDIHIIFARNLYNKTVSGQTTTSVVQIPNTLLNDTTINQSNLLGQTDFVLVDDDTDITKNIYETLNINFANTISMRNDNNVNNKILNPTGASRLNASTTQTTDYDNAKGLHLKINYADNTNSIIALDSSQVTFTSDTEATYSFTIYVPKAINNLQITSNDDNTIYQTISDLNLTVGKTYTITQDVEVI